MSIARRGIARFGIARFGIARFGITGLGRRPTWLLAVGGLCLCLAFIGCSAWFVVHQRARAIEEEGRHLRNISASVAANASRTIHSLAQATARLSERLLEEGETAETVRAAMTAPGMSAMLQDVAASLPPSQAILMIDADGMLANHSRSMPATALNLSDRDYFRMARDGSVPDVFITEPVVSRRMRNLTFHLAQRVTGRDGAFVGLLLGAIEVRYFEDLFGRSTLSQGGTINLWRQDGMLLARSPAGSDAIGRTFGPELQARLKRGHANYFRTTSGVDGSDRLVAMMRLPGYPLSVAVTEPIEEVLRGWTSEAAWIGVATVLVCLATALIVLLVFRGMRVHARLERATAALRVDEERHRATDALARQHTRFAAALDNMNQGVVMFGREGRLLLANTAMHAILGLPPGRLVAGMTPVDVIVAAIREGNLGRESVRAIQASYMAPLAAGVSSRYVRRLADGRYLTANFAPFDGGWLTTYEDVTERRMAEDRIVHMAHHDSLTGLPNRVALRTRAEEAISRAARGEPFAVLCLDLDQFKDVNDTLGHLVGDRLLCMVAERLCGLSRRHDLIARLGGDEFAILVQPMENVMDASDLAQRVVEALSTPFTIDGQGMLIGASIGIAVAPQDGSDPETLMKKADLALYRAKSEGRGRARFFEPDMERQLKDRRRVESELREALVEGEFELFYQPLVRVETRRLIGFEALMRWRHPLRGLVSPAEFIPIAEDNGFIIQMGEWVLIEACREAAGWPEPLRVGVNLSPIQFRSKQLEATVESALARSGLQPDRLELEITESSMMHDPRATLATLERLKAMGVRIAMDDFGTGHSSLAHLHRFPFDKVKIDRAFICDIEQPTKLAIVQAVTGIARSMSIGTSAEGVETEAQLERIAREGCDEAQGYLFGAPAPASDIAALLRRMPLAGARQAGFAA